MYLFSPVDQVNSKYLSSVHTIRSHFLHVTVYLFTSQLCTLLSFTSYSPLFEEELLSTYPSEKSNEKDETWFYFHSVSRIAFTRTARVVMIFDGISFFIISSIHENDNQPSNFRKKIDYGTSWINFGNWQRYPCQQVSVAWKASRCWIKCHEAGNLFQVCLPPPSCFSFLSLLQNRENLTDDATTMVHTYVLHIYIYTRLIFAFS